jgi:NDP-sugar pyrophosphorylase family protein
MINGDILTNIDPIRLTENKSHSLSLVPLKSPYGMVDVDASSNVLGFVEKPEIHDFWINAGVYYFTNDVFDYLPSNGNMEVTALPEMAKQNKLKAIKYENSFWRSIDSHKDIEEASKDLKTHGLV